MIYIRCYKTIYILVITVNLILRLLNVYGFAASTDDWYIYIINIVAIILNVLGYLALEKGMKEYLMIEKLLSILRMGSILAMASLFLGFIVVILPTALALWTPIMKLNLALGFFWAICIVLLTLEAIYFKKLKDIPGKS